MTLFAGWFRLVTFQSFCFASYTSYLPRNVSVLSCAIMAKISHLGEMQTYHCDSWIAWVLQYLTSSWL